MNSSLLVFLLLQALDFATTVIALSIGGREHNPLILGFMSLGPIRGLILSKAIIIALASVVVVIFRKHNALRWANVVFALIVAWNLSVIARLALAS